MITIAFTSELMENLFLMAGMLNQDQWQWSNLMSLFLIHSFNNVYINVLELNVYNSAAGGMYTISLQGKLFLQILSEQLNFSKNGFEK